MKKSFKRLLTSLLNIFGITSLTSCLGGGGLLDFGGGAGAAVCMYGVPCNSFTVTGIVSGDTDNDGKVEPVNGIKVKMLPAGTEDPSLYGDDYGISSGQDGTFTVDYSTTIGNTDFENLKFVVYFEDVDGEENGSFETKKVEVEFKNADKKKDSAFTTEYEIKDLKVQLSAKKQD